MKKVLLMSDKKSNEFDTFKDMFQYLSEEKLVITDLQDGAIEAKDSAGKEKSFTFAIVETRNTSDMLVQEVSVYRDELRSSITLLKKQGINVPKEELDKMAAQLFFLKKYDNAPVKEAAKEIKEEIVPEEDGEEIPA